MNTLDDQVFVYVMAVLPVAFIVMLLWSAANP
jgi:hypothetical protein